MLAYSWIRFLTWPTVSLWEHWHQHEGEGRAAAGRGSMGWHQTLLPLVASCCETAGHVLPTHVSHHTSHRSMTWTSSWPDAQIIQWADVSECSCMVPAQEKHWKWMMMGRRGRVGELLSGAVGSWVRLGVVWNQARAEEWVEAPSQRVHVRHSKRLAIYSGGEIEVYLILLEVVSLCAVACSHSPPSPSATRTGTLTQWLLYWCGKMLHGELHIPKRSSVCVWSHDGSLQGTLNLCSSQISI